VTSELFLSTGLTLTIWRLARDHLPPLQTDGSQSHHVASSKDLPLCIKYRWLANQSFSWLECVGDSSDALHFLHHAGGP
jgi:hypothetical protein